MSNEKDKLIELLKDTLHEWECDVQFETISEIAEHLIENSVVVPPCKVGDTVYYTEDIGIQTSLEIVEYIVENITIGIKPSRCILYCKTKKRGFKDRFFNNSFGKTIFFTREEAEQALKEGVNNA